MKDLETTIASKKYIKLYTRYVDHVLLIILFNSYHSKLYSLP